MYGSVGLTGQYIMPHIPKKQHIVLHFADIGSLILAKKIRGVNIRSSYIRVVVNIHQK